MLSTTVDVRPTGRVIVTVEADADYNPDALEDMANRAARLVRETLQSTADLWTGDDE